MCAELCVEELNHVSCKNVHEVVVVTELRELSLDVESLGETVSVAASCYLCILDGRKRVGYDRKTCYSVCEVDLRVGVDERHL